MPSSVSIPFRPMGKNRRGRKRAHIWQIGNMLNSLKLNFEEFNEGNPNYRIDVPLFGIRFRINNYSGHNDIGWDVIQIDAEAIKRSTSEISDKLMWLLIEKGYMAYAREQVGGRGETMFRQLVVDQRWGEKIINKRIEMCEDKPKHMFKKLRMEEFLKLGTHRIIAYYPGFFDYL